jgi:hypothetical protein
LTIDRDLDPRAQVHFIETDLPPIQVALPIHVATGFGVCIAGLITQVLPNGEVFAELHPPPGHATPYRDERLQYQPGGMGVGTYHRLLECPDLNRHGWQR